MEAQDKDKIFGGQQILFCFPKEIFCSNRTVRPCDRSKLYRSRSPEHDHMREPGNTVKMGFQQL